MVVSVNVWGADTKTLTFSLTSNPGSWPTTNPTTLTNYTYTLDQVAYTFGLKNVKCNSGYLMLSYTAALGLPAIKDYKLTKVVAKNSGGCSTSTKVGISSSPSSASYISGGAIQTWSTTSSTYTYNLSGTSNNTVYYLYVTNKNAQITELTLTYEGGTASTTVSLNANSSGKADGSVKYTVGNATPDATPSWVTPKDNTGWILNGYYTAASGGTKIITASNTLVANTTYADASNKWKYKETSLTLYAQWGTTTCATPSNLGQTSVTATSATLTWGTVTGAASYTVYITDADSYEKTIDNITTNSVFLDDLSPNTEYMWKVTAIGDALKGYDDGKSNDDGDFTTEQACTNEITISKSTATLPSGCSFSLDKTSGCGDDEGESVEVTCSPATHYTVTAVNSTSGIPGAISNNKCTVSGIKANTTISVTFTEDTKYTITFADKLHSESVSAKSVYENETFTFPTIDDKTAATSGTCEQVHYHFMGWVLSTHEGTIAAGDIKTGTSDAVTDAATYYAVWAKEEL